MADEATPRLPARCLADRGPPARSARSRLSHPRPNPSGRGTRAPLPHRHGREGSVSGPAGSMTSMEPASHGERAGAAQGLSQLRLDENHANGHGPDPSALDLDG